MKIRKFTGLVGIFWAWLVLMPVQPVFAVDFSNTVSTVLTINDFDKRSTVSMTMKVTNKTAVDTPNAIDFAAVGSDVSNIVSRFSDGSKGTNTYNADTGLITVETNKSFKGKNKTWSIKLSYTTKAVTELGDSKLSLIPGNFAGGDTVNFTSETRTIKLDLNLGVAHQLGAKAAETTLGVGQQILKWQEDGPIDYSTGVMFGQNALAEIDISTKLENKGLWWKTFTVTLPPDTNQQRVYIDSLSPKPNSVSVDIDGNILAKYKLMPFTSVEVSAKASVLVNNYTYALSEAEDTQSESDLSGLSSYLKTNSRWSPIDVELAEDSNQLEKVEVILKAVRENVTPTGEDVLANSVEINDALIGTFRANNFPARAVRGLVTDSYGSTPRAWAEVHISGLGWISIDASIDTGGFRTADARYVALLIRGIKSDYPPSRVTDTTVTYVEGSDLPTSQAEAELSTTVYMILPGVGLRTSKATLPDGQITDNVGLIYSDIGSAIKLGSIAPLQTAVVRDFLFAGDAFATSKAEFGVIQTVGGFTVLTETDSVVSWIPFIVLVVVLIAVGLFITYARRRKKQGKRLFSNKMRKPDISDGADATDVPEKLDRLPKVPKWRQQPQPQSHPVITPQPQAEVESQPEIKPVNDMFKPINNSANQEPTVLKPHIQPEPTMKPQQSTDLSQIRPEDNQTKRTNKPNSLIQ